MCRLLIGQNSRRNVPPFSPSLCLLNAPAIQHGLDATASSSPSYAVRSQVYREFLVCGNTSTTGEG